jgi:branched-chain amino acid transport system substrate-binding protein
MQKNSAGFMKTILGLVVAVLVIWGLVSLSDGGSKGPIKIGFIGSLTGDAAAYGEPARNITAMAVEEINKAGGVNGRMIEVIYEDGKCNGKDATNAAQKLVNVDKVQVIIGGFCSSESLAAVPVAEGAKVALISPGSSSPDLTGKSSYFVRNYPADTAQGKVLAEAANSKGWKKVAFLQEQTDYALGVFKAFSSRFVELGGVVIKEEFPTATSDFRSMIVKLKAEKPDALFIDTQTPAVAEKALKQFQESKWKVQLLVNDVVPGNPSTVTQYAKVLEGALTAEFGVDPTNAKFTAMLADYKAKYGAEPPYQSYAQTEYDAVYLVRDALLASGDNGEKIAAWFRTVKDWEGASGKITIQADGDRSGGHRLETIKDGKVEVVD